MRLTSRRTLALFVSLICVATPVTAQKKPSAQPEKFRKQQLLIVHDNLFSRALDSVKKMDEVALRVSARNQLLTYLWETNTRTDKNTTLAKNLALDAIADLENNHLEMLPFMFDYLSQDLAALLSKHQVDLTPKLQAVIESAKTGRQSHSVRSLLELKNGDRLAAARIRQALAQGADIKELHFWLDDLRKLRSPEFEPLLRDVIAVASSGPQLSFDTLFWLSPIYFQPDVPTPLQKSFAAMIVARTHPANFAATPAPPMAYDLLNGALPQLQQLDPELANQALGQSLILRSTMDRSQIALEERRKRIKESQNPIEEMVQEAEAAKTKSERNELLAEAASKALHEKKFSLCLNIVSKVDPVVVEQAQVNFWGSWTIQFLRKLVKEAATAKEIDIAEKAALSMTASLAKAQALVSLIRYRNEANDKDAAHEIFAEAVKAAEATVDEFDKAKAFVFLSSAADRIDGSKNAALLLSAIKTLNNVKKPTNAQGEQSLYREYVRNLDNTGYQLTAGFRKLTRHDENAAISLVDQLQKSDLRTFALIGVLLGLNDLLTKPEGKESSLT